MSKAGFITTTSHEFRTSLAIILSAAETLRIYRDKLTDTQIEERLNKISHQVEHLKTLMADVIELSRLQVRRARFLPIPIAPDELCDAIVTEFQEYIAVAHPLVYMRNARLPVLNLDERLMRQIITNLLSNSIKYSAVDKPVSLQLVYQDETLCIIVKDEGIGIPASDMKHLFQPFYRASNVGTIPGTGLGLVIAKEWAELHGGMISLESQFGKGATFTVRIPRT